MKSARIAKTIGHCLSIKSRSNDIIPHQCALLKYIDSRVKIIDNERPKSSPLFLLLAWWPSWLKVRITGHNFGKGPHKDHSTKVWLQLAQWFLRRRFLCVFPIGSNVKLSSAVGVILVELPNRRTLFWTRTIQWLFHQHFFLIEQMVSDKKIFMGISHRVLC